MSECNGSCGKGAGCPSNVKKVIPLGIIGLGFISTYFPQLKFFSLAAVGIASAYGYYKFTSQEQYNPLVNRDYSFTYEGEKIISNADSNNYILANEKGSHIWSKGLSYIELDDGADNLYFSLCSTKIIDRKVTTILNFNLDYYKIWLFCTKKQVELQEINIHHKIFVDKEYTCIEVRDTALCLVGDVHLAVENIAIANKTYIDAIF